ncbi:MAG: DUF924 family protein [Bdellovibrionales bacterium]
MEEYKNILDFWFEELSPMEKFQKNSDLDNKIKTRFLHLVEKAEKSECWRWRETPQGSLAEIILLDQFKRNIFRDQARAFSSDSFALSLTQNAISKGFDQDLNLEYRSFLYMPFQHSESLAIHEEGLRLMQLTGLDDGFIEYEIKHKVIIERFGRYPHRNEILGRESTDEEISFLQEPNSSF